MLFNPDMILLGDDDTYVKFELLQRLKSQLHTRLNSEYSVPPVARVMGGMMFSPTLTASAR